VARAACDELLAGADELRPLRIGGIAAVTAITRGE